MIYSFIYIISLVHVASFMSGPRAGNMMRRLSFSQHAQQGLLQAAETRSALYPVLGRSRYALRLQAKKSEEEDSKPKAVKKAAVVKKAPKEKVEKVEKATAKVVEVEVEAAEAPKKKALKAKKGEETVEPAKKVVKAKGPKAKPPVKGKLDEEAQGAKLGGLDFDALLGENFDFSAEGIARLGLLPNLDEDLAELEANLGELGLGEDFSFLDDDGADDPLAGLDLNDDILKQLQALGAKGTKKGAKLGKKGKGKAAELDQDLDLELGEADFSMDELMKMVEEEEEEPVVKAKKTKPAVRKPAPQKEEKEEEEEDDDDDFSSQAMRRMKLAHDDDDLGLDVIIKDDEDEEDDEDLDIEEEPKKKKKPPARTSRAFTPVDLDLDMDLDDDDGPITLATSAEIVAKGLNARGRKASKAGGKKLRKGLSAEEDLELGIVDPPPVEEFKRLMESLGPDSMFEESSTDQFFEEDMEPATKKKRGRKRASVEDGEEEEEVGEDDDDDGDAEEDEEVRISQPTAKRATRLTATDAEYFEEVRTEEEQAWLPNIYTGGKPSPSSLLETPLPADTGTAGVGSKQDSPYYHLYAHDDPTDWRVQIVSVVTNSTANSTALQYVRKVYDYIKAGTNNDERIVYQTLSLSQTDEQPFEELDDMIQMWLESYNTYHLVDGAAMKEAWGAIMPHIMLSEKNLEAILAQVQWALSEDALDGALLTPRLRRVRFRGGAQEMTTGYNTEFLDSEFSVV
eukprot:CAMPEP_0173363026 /NCGR_PEP_ID=MMETSP1144-20121109/22152_1 /TAXON_ID=483371 /ORGANISM="non described non described, Strain CCMP2298" /LENGTH=738 /DNA_ID=CAMNT_0014312921 /DNA_START=90 /DNA_END=2303 /DNA_ORIENTATION=+